MIIRLDPDSPVPTFEQIRSQVMAMINSSVLKTGARLPTVRQLAKDLGTAPGTVARAYQELEREGAIQTQGRHGTFVADSAGASQTQEQLEQAAESLALQGYQLGMSVDQLADTLRRAFRTVTASS